MPYVECNLQMPKVNFHTQINAENHFGTIIAIWKKWSHKKPYGKK